MTVTLDAPLVCSRCGDWPDAPGARTGVWSTDDDVTLCPACVLRAACERIGHRWGRWTTLGPTLSGSPAGGRCRHCRVCTAGQFQMPALTGS